MDENREEHAEHGDGRSRDEIIPREHRRFGNAFKSAALIAGALLLLAGVAALLFLVTTRGSGGVEVPELTGMSYRDAREAAQRSGLEIEIDARQDSSCDCNELQVTRQDPKPGTTVEEGDLVTVRLKGLNDSIEYLDEDGGEAVETRPYPEDPESGEPIPPQGQAPEQETVAGHSVCIDPGHSADCPASQIDPATGLNVADNGGAAGERKAMWELATRLESLLRERGYSVSLTKQGENAYSSLRTRADIGNTCEVVVRLHYDPNLQAIIYPGNGQSKSHGDSTVYVDPGVAAGSARLAEALHETLSTVGITRMMNDCGGTSGNTGSAFVGSVLSRVPVVLIENDPDTVRDNPAGQQRVARAIADGLDSYFR